MIKKSVFVLFFVALFCISSASAQTAYTPAKGSAERTAIMNSLRVPVEKKLKKKTIFAVNNFRVQGNWAFLDGTPQKADGSAMEYSGTEYQNAIDAGMFDSNFFALLKKTGGKWKIVTYQIGCTDICYLSWANDYKAPKAIFPSTMD